MGYPPLIFAIKYGYFYIAARSDPNYFKKKGGCAIKDEYIFDRNQSKVNCDDDLELQILWTIPMSEFPLDEFVSWRWEIKWSEYTSKDTKRFRTKPGEVSVYINKSRKVRWKGNVGRNEEGRIPYIKLGIYNADGSPERFSSSIMIKTG